MWDQGENVMLTSHQLVQRPIWALISHPDQGRPTLYGWWSPVILCYIKRWMPVARNTRFIAAIIPQWQLQTWFDIRERNQWQEVPPLHHRHAQRALVTGRHCHPCYRVDNDTTMLSWPPWTLLPPPSLLMVRPFNPLSLSLVHIIVLVLGHTMCSHTVKCVHTLSNEFYPLMYT